MSNIHSADRQPKPSARDDRGATAVEYGMIVALIAAVVIGTVAVLGGSVADAYDSVVGTF